MQSVAPNYTHVPAGSTLQRIGETPISGGTTSLIIYGIVLSSSSASSEIVFYEEDGSTIITRLRVSTTGPSSAPNSVLSHNCKFLAKNGLKVTTPANGSCTVYHSNSGG